MTRKLGAAVLSTLLSSSLLFVITISVVFAGKGADLPELFRGLAAIGDKSHLDSLVFAERYASYKFLQNELEKYFDDGDTQRLRLTGEVAAAVERLFDDSYYANQLRRYQFFREKAFERRRPLKEEFFLLLDSLGALPASVATSRFEHLAERFLQIQDSAAAVKVLQYAGSLPARLMSNTEPLTFLARSMRISRASGDLDGLARSFNLLGSYYQHAGYFAKAGEYYDSARALRTELQDRKGLADCLSNIAGIYASLGEASESYRFANEALRLRREIADTLQICQSLFNMIAAFRYDLSAEVLKAWLGEARTLVATNGDDQLRVRLLQASGMVAEGEGLFDSAMACYHLAQSVLNEKDQPAFGVSLLTNIAALFSRQGDHSAALRAYLDAEKLASASNNRLALANLLHNIGALYQTLGDFENAVRYYQRSLDVKQQLNLPNETIETLNNLAEISLATNDRQTASRYLTQSTQIARAYDNPRLLAASLISLAGLRQQEKDHVSAFADLDTALALYRKAGNLQGQLDVQLLMTEYARVNADYIRAQQQMALARRLLESCNTYGNVQRYEMTAGLVWSDMGQQDSAFSYLSRVVARLETARRNIPDAELRAYHKSRTRFVYEKVVSILCDRYERQRQRSTLDSLIGYVELAKARSLLDMVNQSRLNTRQRVPTGLIAKEQSLLTKVERVEQALIKATTSGGRDSLTGHLTQLNAELAEVRLKQSLADPQADRLFSPDRSSLGKIVSVLPDRSSAILDYLLAADSSLLIVITKQGREIYRLPSRQAVTLRLIDYLRLLHSSVGGESLIDSLRIAAGELARLVFSGFSAEIGKYSSLFIAADGALAFLPFESLLIGDKFLIEDAEVTMVPSLFLLSEWKPSQRPRSPRLLALADPKPDDNLRALPYSLKEAEWIAALFGKGQCKLLTGAAAAKSFLFSPELKQYDYIHFATHSTINQDDPSRSRIWLSRDTTADSSNYLSLNEVTRLSLTADLVVLSSCESGGGRFQLGEGIEGFVRAFMYAGCRNVVVSLWEVEDFASAVFMKTFYQNLGNGYAAALRQAKMEMIKSKRRPHRHPYFWAPFVLVQGK